MLCLRITCISLILVFAIAASGTSESGIRTWGPKNCDDIYRAGSLFEGYYAVFTNILNPDEAELVYCGVDDGMLRGNSSAPKTNPKNCQDLKNTGMDDSGINVIYPYADHPETPVIVFCEQILQGGGWTLFQRRDDYATQLDFHKSFNEYSLGFGNPGSEFWLGLDILNEITQQSVNELYIELTSFADITKYANYKMFNVANKTARNGCMENSHASPYKLTADHYSGDAGNALEMHSGMGFSTYNADHDSSSDNCAATYKGGWWYHSCHDSNLNGVYYDDGSSHTDSANWLYFSNSRESLKKIRMMSRPIVQQ